SALTGLRENHGIDPDHFPFVVEKRPAAVARVDRGVGLEEVVEGPEADGAVLRADDAARDRVLQPERVADGEHGLGDADLVGVGRPDRGEAAGDPALVVADLEEGYVELGILADDAGLELPLVGERDHYLRRAVDD